MCQFLMNINYFSHCQKIYMYQILYSVLNMLPIIGIIHCIFTLYMFLIFIKNKHMTEIEKDVKVQTTKLSIKYFFQVNLCIWPFCSGKQVCLSPGWSRDNRQGGKKCSHHGAPLFNILWPWWRRRSGISLWQLQWPEKNNTVLWYGEWLHVRFFLTITALYFFSQKYCVYLLDL